MNKVILIGRLVRDPECRNSSTGTTIANFTLAVDRRFKTGDVSADFIRCLAFGKLAEFTQKYLKKGIKISVVGRIQTGSYTDSNNRKVYTTDVIAEELEFAESKKVASENAVTTSNSNSENSASAKTSSRSSKSANNNFVNVPENAEEDEELPF